MIRQIEFKNRTGNELQVEFVKYKSDFLVDGVPEIFNNVEDDYAKLAIIGTNGTIFLDGDAEKKPVYFFRHCNVGSTRWVGFIEPGDQPLLPQKGGHTENLADKFSKMNPYKKISDSPVAYAMGADDPYFEHIFYDDHAVLKEGDFLDVEIEYFPYALIDHHSLWNKISVIYQACVLKGSYEGKPVMGLCHTDRSYMEKHGEKEYTLLGYFDNVYEGIREDGRKESANIHIDSTGKVFGFYWLEGEEPVFSDTVVMEAEWMRVPYCNDGTCVYQDAVYKFAGKEIHFNGKWGTKGYTAEPRIKDKPGQSQMIGTWYEGKTPYKHKLFSTFCENQEAYDYNIKKMGFDII